LETSRRPWTCLEDQRLVTHSADHLKSFRLRWSRKRRADEDDIVPSPSLVNSDVFLPDQPPTLNPPLSAATERDHTTSVTNAFLMEWSRQQLYCLGTTIACANFGGTIAEHPCKLECTVHGSHG
jgi:hypothetical protein